MLLDRMTRMQEGKMHYILVAIAWHTVGSMSRHKQLPQVSKLLCDELDSP